MKLYCSDDNYKLYQGSMLDMADVIAENSVDAIVTDPPYELNFMNKGWDNTGIAFQKETWEKCLRVLKPGGHLLAFGGSRTFHRIACAIEDAGFEIRDTIMYLYGSGFPKSMNLGKSVEAKLTRGSANKQAFKELDGEKVKAGDWGISKNTFEYGARSSDYSADEHLRTDKVDYKTEEGKKWDSWGTCLKPSYEPVIVARKPCEGSVTNNVLKWGVGGLNIDECRVPMNNEDFNEIKAKSSKNPTDNYNKNEAKKYGDYKLNIATPPNENGRFPANTILTYDETDFDEVCGGMPDSGNGNGKGVYSYAGRKYDNAKTSMFNGDCPQAPSNYNDNGSVARYFYCAKASRRDRDEGLEDLEAKPYSFSNQAQADLKRGKLSADERLIKNTVQMRHNVHPCVKPTSLMSYLVRLVTPNGGVVLDPFNGSGSTGKATMYENRDNNKGYTYIGIELSEEYLAISKARIDYAIGKRKEDNQVIEFTQMSLFDYIAQ